MTSHTSVRRSLATLAAAASLALLAALGSGCMDMGEEASSKSEDLNSPLKDIAGMILFAPSD